jgi:hypothetical protein
VNPNLKDKVDVLMDRIKETWNTQGFTVQEALQSLMGICAQTHKLNNVPLNIAVACFIEHYQSAAVRVDQVQVAASKTGFDA